MLAARKLHCELLEDRTAPARSISPDAVLASIIEVAPVNVGAPGTTPFARLGIEASRVTPVGPGLVSIATSGSDPEALVAQLQATPGVAWAQPNYVYQVATEAAYTPNDKNYPNQDSLAVYRVAEAWGELINLGKPLGNTGTVIAVLDEGIAVSVSTATPTHADLANGPGGTSGIARNTAELGNDEDGNGFVGDFSGWDFTSPGMGDNDPSPNSGANHGHEVAGIIAARTNNFNDLANTSRIAGIAGGMYDDNADGGNGDQVGGVRILPVRVIDGSTLTSASLAGGLNYLAVRNVRIANMSFDLDEFANDAAVQSAMTNAYNAGTLLIASAGNTGTKDAARGAFDQVLFVAGTNNASQISRIEVNGQYSSNYGAYVDISAPSENIITLGQPSNTFTTSGTSLAAPAVAGVAALLLAQNPSYTRDQLAAKLLGTAVNIDALNPGYEGQLGAGRVDALNALTAALPAPTITDFKVDGLNIQNGGTVNGISTITLTVPRRLNPASVNANSLELRSDGSDNVFGTGDDQIVPVTLASPYRMGDVEISLSIAGTLTSDHYRFTAKSGSPHLRDPFDMPLGGTPGANFARSFDILAPAFFGEAIANTNRTTIDGAASAVFDDGSYATTWAARNVDGDGWGIFARRFDASGQPLTAEFLVNQATAGNQQYPSITALDDQGFVIAWRTKDASNQFSVSFRRFNANGTPNTSETIITSGVNIETNTHLARGFGNGFMLGYSVEVSTFSTPILKIYSGANALIAEPQIAPAAKLDLASLATDSSGNLTVLYSRWTGDWDTAFSRFSKDGTPLGSEVTVSGAVGVNEVARSIAIDGQQNSLVVYEADVSTPGIYSLYGQSFNSSGEKGGAAFLISSNLASSIGTPPGPHATLVRDIHPGASASTPSQPFNHNGTLFF